MDCKKSDKVALVTGSATGIGANIARDLAATGDYRVVITGRNRERMDEVVKQCPNSAAFEANLYDMEQVDSLINFVRSFGRLDILINNACWRGNTKSILEDGSYKDMEKVIQINVLVPLYLAQKCLIPLRPNGGDWAVIVNISSSASKIVVPLHLYSISKACLSEMSKQLAAMSEGLGIYSITVSPGPVLTNERPRHIEMSKLTLLNRVGTTQEISDFVMFILTMPHIFNGQELFIDGGYIAKSSK